MRQVSGCSLALVDAAVRRSPRRRPIPTGRSSFWCRSPPAARSTSSRASSPTRWASQLGQRPFVENQAGGAGVIGMRAGARAGAGRLHRDRAERQRADHGAEHEGGRRLRPVRRLHAGDAAGRHSARPDRPSVVRGQQHRRADRARQKDAGRHQLFLRRSRQPAACRHGVVRARRRHPDDACAASRRDRSRDRDRLRQRAGRHHRRCRR